MQYEQYLRIQNAKELSLCVNKAMNITDNAIYLKGMAKFKWENYYMDINVPWYSDEGKQIAAVFDMVLACYPTLHDQIELLIDDELDLCMALEEVNPDYLKPLFT